MKTVIVIAALMTACSGAEESTSDKDSPTVLQAQQLIGRWCADDLCLNVHDTSYGKNWLVYSWESPDCIEGGLIQADDPSVLLFGAIDFDMRGCFSKLTPNRYSGTFTLHSNGELTAQLSVLPQALVLKEQLESR